jgi:hypothetical protein
MTGVSTSSHSRDKFYTAFLEIVTENSQSTGDEEATTEEVTGVNISYVDESGNTVNLQITVSKDADGNTIYVDQDGNVVDVDTLQQLINKADNVEKVTTTVTSNSNSGSVVEKPNKTPTVSSSSSNSEGSLAYVPTGSSYTLEQVEQDISNGKYTKEDLDYMCALTGEASGYTANLAVVSTVLNRSKAYNMSIKDVVTANNQYAGYNKSAVGNYSIDVDLFNASVALLRGDESSIVGDCKYFFGKVNGNDLWAEKGAGTVYNYGSNIFYSSWGKVHNSKGSTPSNGYCIYKCSSKEWLLKDGEKNVY